MFQLQIIIIYQINHIFSGFIIRPCRYPETSLYQIYRLRNFWSFFPSWDGIPLGMLGDCWEKLTFGKSDVFQNPLETGHPINSVTDAPLMTGLSCNCCTVLYGVIIFFYYFLVKLLARELEFRWDIPQYLKWTKYPWGWYSLVHQFLRCVAQYLSNLGLLCLNS